MFRRAPLANKSPLLRSCTPTRLRMVPARSLARAAPLNFSTACRSDRVKCGTRFTGGNLDRPCLTSSPMGRIGWPREGRVVEIRGKRVVTTQRERREDDVRARRTRPASSRAPPSHGCGAAPVAPPRAPPPPCDPPGKAAATSPQPRPREPHVA
jgi:hypothetical protein